MQSWRSWKAYGRHSANLQLKYLSKCNEENCDQRPQWCISEQYTAELLMGVMVEFIPASTPICCDFAECTLNGLREWDREIDHLFSNLSLRQWLDMTIIWDHNWFKRIQVCTTGLLLKVLFSLFFCHWTSITTGLQTDSAVKSTLAHTVPFFSYHKNVFVPIFYSKSDSSQHITTIQNDLRLLFGIIHIPQR